MLKRFSLIASVVLFSAINADNNIDNTIVANNSDNTVVVESNLAADSDTTDSTIVTNDSFSCEISREQATTIWTILPLEESNWEKFTQSLIEITATQDGSNFDDLIVKTIKELVKEIDPATAAHMYFDSIENTLNKALDKANFESIVATQNEDEAKQALGKMLQEVFGAITSKEVALEQAIYFATFTDEIVKEITAAMSSCMQDYLDKIGQLQYTENREGIASEIKTTLSDCFASVMNSIATVFEIHGYFKSELENHEDNIAR